MCGINTEGGAVGAESKKAAEEGDREIGWRNAEVRVAGTVPDGGCACSPRECCREGCPHLSMSPLFSGLRGYLSGNKLSVSRHLWANERMVPEILFSTFLFPCFLSLPVLLHLFSSESHFSFFVHRHWAGISRPVKYINEFLAPALCTQVTHWAASSFCSCISSAWSCN